MTPKQIKNTIIYVKRSFFPGTYAESESMRKGQ